ncbi:bifunctional tRNA (adenosine(37)-C2)-methyltransferase TrmG/ribosomal RNA large subunit methyltransferase RlmN, partial [Myxococcota bacterium]|nr:bifunctional tRNA (adenosine(37)-C2)-methyltransferase TrmG/ribosomal RNA large subunit methyltransferase RlmN [Myxococcota bacterium]
MNTKDTQGLKELDSQSDNLKSDKINLLGLPQNELRTLVKELGEPGYRAEQIFAWLHQQQALSFDKMGNLPARLRQKLEDTSLIALPRIDKVQVAPDGTRKYRFMGPDQIAYEGVYIPEVAAGRKTNTLCISSQTGCALGCKFCFTASLRKNRNLSAAEIVGQVAAAALDVQPLGESARITNIVFMGMG